MDIDDSASNVRVSESIQALTRLVPSLVRRISKQLNDKRKKAGKAKIAGFKLLSALLAVIPGSFSAENITKLIPG